ncbi:DUF4238 domain-containing protein [Aneurinibacillus migulanus]|uniref:DUF4238 domain-containing protein n=1 Tax=Aneurinibacillus migulanus TaxID=47500 RepID=A0A0D1Y0V9_ANEMI|nr:DUF4238 domain-containing protein [Aneurinibacillus migulanus]KIV52892.1 hypothetical protein TS65_22600 [Aneurinibacillus migulanus]KON95169.1 hypothetical protein AF333_06440 [Aneurinibacillus migulanus]MED0890904.1 DUF4238 domain-containing protein [Aneurinibacillus migulanus]MED1616596.1 DUF4238 domain-containing protein [Aneurinibacillus migulanus]SDI82164.1 Protein of unknown function [Aneurinibacillus migulanus]
MEKKRGQHYVWRYYLTSWTDDSGNLFCLRNNKLFPVNPKNIAKARDFYRLRNISRHEISIIEQGFIMDYWTEEIQQINKNWINMFTSVFRQKELLEHAGKWDDEKELKLDLIMNNLVEDFHSEIEEATLPYLDSLKSGNIDFLKSENGKFDFMFFLCLQYFRTNMIKNNVLKSFASGSLPISPTLIQNIWSVLYFILATNLAIALSSSSTFRVLMLRNISPVPFITGDQPVINTFADYSVYEEAKELELYYPLSPSLALLITNSNNHNSDQSIFDVQENGVTMYNNLIFNASDEQIYANDVTVLQSFIK